MRDALRSVSVENLTLEGKEKLQFIDNCDTRPLSYPHN